MSEIPTKHSQGYKKQLSNVSPIKESKISSNAKSNTKTKAKIYKQKFRNNWINEEFSPWLIRCPCSPEIPYCTFCKKKLEGGISHLRRHAKSGYHKKRDIAAASRINLDNIDGQECKVQVVDHTLPLHQPQPAQVIHHSSQTGIHHPEHSAQQFIPTSQQITHHMEVSHIEMSHLNTQHLQSHTVEPSHLQSHTVESSHLQSSNLPHLASNHLGPVDVSIKHLSHISSHHLELQQADISHHQLQGSGQDIIVTTAGITTDGNLFHPTIAPQNKTETQDYIVEYEHVASAEVTVPSSGAPDMTLGPDAGHITVTIQGQDPMYIQSVTEHVQHVNKMEPDGMPLPPSEVDIKQVKKKRGRSRSGHDKSTNSMPSPRLKASNSSSIEEDADHTKRGRKWYRQKYASHWDTAKEFFKWLTRAPNDPSIAYCLACEKRLRGGVAHLRRHAATPYHRKRMQETCKKRQTHLAQQAELSLTRFAHKYNVSDAAVCAIPEVLLALFPDSEVCKLLSTERMMSMMLVRKEEDFSENCPSPEELDKVLNHLRDKLSQTDDVKFIPCKCTSHDAFHQVYTYVRAPSSSRSKKLTAKLSNQYQQTCEQQQCLMTQHTSNSAVGPESDGRPLNIDTHASSFDPHQSNLDIQPLNIDSHQSNHDSHPSNPHQSCHNNHQSDIDNHNSNLNHNSHYSVTQSYMESHHGGHQSELNPNNQYQSVSSQSEIPSPVQSQQDISHNGSTDNSNLVQPSDACDTNHEADVLTIVSNHSLNQSSIDSRYKAFPRHNTLSSHEPVPSPSQYETLSASSGSVIVHQADTSHSESIRSYAFDGYHHHHHQHHHGGYGAIEQVCGSDRWHGRVALVTGASAGIGAAVCRSLVRLGMVVVGVARSQDRVQALAEELTGESGTLTAIKCDISKDDQVRDMFQQVTDTFGGIHLCINNAGFSANHSLLEGTPEEWRGMLSVNVVGLCLITKLAVQNMRDRGVDDGHIIHVSSMSGHRVTASANTHFYAATKQAVRALTEGLRQELRAAQSHIRVSSISPGMVVTNFSHTMLGDAAAANKVYASMECLRAEDVAASVLHILTAPPHVEINDLLMRPTEQAS